jgi:two-component system chemotaxis sensor kinase CheA
VEATSPRPSERQGHVDFHLRLATDLEEAEVREGSPFALDLLGIDIEDGPAGRASLPPQGTPGIEAEGAAWSARREVSVRVDLERLDRILSAAGDLVLDREEQAAALRDLGAAGEAPRAATRRLLASGRAMDRHLSEIRRHVLGARMIPFSRLASRLARLSDRLAHESGLDVEFVADVGRTEVDKDVLDRLAEPLMHLVRNALAHGIEGAAEREAARKPRRARLLLTAMSRGNQVLISLADDGRGIDREAVLEAAARMGLLTRPEDGGEARILDLVIAPGLSTAAAANRLAGRGLGLDIVRRLIGSLNGSIEVRSPPGQGTRFVLELPVSLALLPCLIVQCGGTDLALPLAAVDEVTPLAVGEGERVLAGRIIRLRGMLLPFADLADRFKGGGGKGATHAVVARAGERRMALGVDRVLGQREVLVKPLGRHLRGVHGIGGATELEARRVALVLDVPSLLSDARALSGAA